MDLDQLERVCGQLLIGGYSGHHVPDAMIEMATHSKIGGMILFSRNIGDNEDEIRSEVEGFQNASSRQLLVCVDQEGGRVQRFGGLGWELPSALEMAKWSSSEIASRSEGLHRRLARLGFNVNFAPVLDVNSNPANPIIGDRAFGDEPKEVIRCASAWAAGAARAGMICCGKHVPGHGDTALDSHLALPVVDKSREELEEIEFSPFRAMTSLPAWMSAHIVYTSLSEEPATLSRHIAHDLIRDEFGFEGVLFSDDLEMKAVSGLYPIEELALRSISAGCDLLLICSRLDLLERAHHALVEKASVDQSFEKRIVQAHARREALLGVNEQV